MKYILSLFILLWSMMIWGQGEGFDPSNPQEPGQKYFLTVTVSPEGAGSTSPSGKNQYALGQKIDLHANANTNYRFVGWRQGTASVSDQPSFNYTIPAAHTQLTALFEYQPNNPSEPSPVPLQHKLLLNAFPAEGGHFNVGSGTIFKEGEIIHLQAYLNSGYEFEGWKQGEDIVSTEGSYSLTMGTEDISLTGMFRFNPSNPINPGANHWDAVTGEVIVDNFAMGNLMGAIDQVIGGSGNRDKVLKITVAGQMNAGDLGVSRYCSSCAIFDLKRISGISSLPAYTFDGSKLQSISLPGDITSIGNYAFRNCANLSEINCYSMIPPTLERDVFQGIGEAIVLRVPQAAIPQYSAAAQWNQLAILPLTEDIGSLSVNLPEAASDGRYKNMTLELINTKSAQKLRFVITDKLKYVFGGLINGEVYNLYLKNTNEVILGEVKELKVTKEGTDTFFNSIVPLYNLSLTVSTNEGVDVSDNVIVKWYNAENKYISQGNELKNLIAGTKINYLIELNSSLGSSYVFPNIKEYVVSEHGNALTYSLQPIDLLDIRGVVKSKDGMLISGAVVSVSQLLNGKYSKSVITKTDKDGKYLLRVYNDVSNITISANGYINQNISRQNFNEGTDLGTTELGIISGATITTNFTYTPSVPIGETPEKQNEYANYQNVSYTLYNKTKARNITDFSVQYPSIVLLEPTNIGDEIQITATSRTYEFEPVVCNVVIDVSNQGIAVLDIVQLGSIQVSSGESENKTNVAMLYNSAEQLVQRYTYSDNAIVTKGLVSGNYTIISMADNRLFNSILNLSELTNTGLQENIDFVKKEITIRNGEIAIVHFHNIPVLDQTKLNYTGSKTSFKANKPTIVAGNYLTLSANIDFKSDYQNIVDNVKLVVDLPKDCSFVTNSILIGNNIATSYDLNNNTLTIPLSDYRQLVRFCIIPTVGGSLIPNAFVEFNLNEKVVKQPIGGANFIVEDLNIKVPAITAQKTVTICGATIGNSTVQVYDNSILIGQTKALANGNWQLKCDLYDVETSAEHDIYAEIYTSIDVKITTEVKRIIYDETHIEVSKVTMINIAHPSTSLNTCEYVTEFNFLEPASKEPIYWYWPNYPDFTFKIEFTNNNPKAISNVLLSVFTSAGNIVKLPALYDEKNKIWVATEQFTADNLPVNVGVSYSYTTFDLTNEVDIKKVFDKAYQIIQTNVVEATEKRTDVLSILNDNTKIYSSLQRYPMSMKSRIEQKFKDRGYTQMLSTSTHNYYNKDASAICIIDRNDNLLLLSVVSEDEYSSLYTDVNARRNLRSSASNGLGRARDHFIQGLINEAERKKQCADEIGEIQLDGAIRDLRNGMAYSLANMIFNTWGAIDGVTGGDPQSLGDAKSFGEGMAGLNSKMQYAKKVIQDTPDCDDPSPAPTGTNYLLDPSGYVYEAVPSNRLQGVTTTVYQKTYEEDMYGDKHEKIEFWNAKEYAQENPLITDENGMYAWDVPAGQWQVKYEKDGYQTAYSEWLPVPPPQLDVNVGLVQNAQPYVKNIYGYETGIEIEFSKFMQPSTMTVDQILVTRNGVAENGEIRMLNEESDPLKENKKSVSKVRFVPKQPFAITDKITLSVSRRVKSYADINMERDFSGEVAIKKEAKSIVTVPDIKVVYNQTAEIKIAVEPKEASVNKKITAFSASSSIASITPEAVLNEEGEATFTVTGELLGSTVLQFAVEGMDLKAEVKVNVVAAGLEDVSRSYQLSMGWNWLSVNVNDKNLNDVAALLEPIKESVVTIKGQNGELTNEESNGLQGSLTIWHPEQAYKIQMKQDATLDLKGKPILAAKSTITLNKGWNWMGYLPTEELSLESALPNLTAEKEDVIKGLDCFAIYTGTAWVGSLTHLTPGEGYMYYSQSVKSFNYAETEAEADAPYPPSQWEYNARQYADNMTLIARLYDREQPVQIDKYLIGAFVGNECRGVAVEKDGYIFLTIHGEQADEQVSLRAFDLTAEKEYTIKEEFHFSETMQGSYASPITLHLGELTGINSITKGLFIYPNPVRDRLYIRGNIDRLEAIYIVNSIGQTCILTDKLSVKEGIDVSSLPKGTYFMTIKSGKEILQQKFIKIE